MPFTNPPARKGLGDFFPVAKRPYTKKPPPPLQRRGMGDFPTVKPPAPPQERQKPPDVGAPELGAQPTPSTPHPAPAAAAAVAGAQADALSQYLAGITDPAERAFVAAQIGPQIAALNAQRDVLNQQAQAQQQALQGFTQALIDHIQGIDYSGPFADIANSQVAAGKAAGESLAAANPQGGTEAILNAIGAPGAQVDALNQLNNDVFQGGGAVLSGTGGMIPSFQTAGEGTGVLGWAAAQPGVAAATGEENMRQLLAQQAAANAQYGTDLNTILAGIPKAQADFATQQQATKDAADKRSMDLYNSGLITQRALAHQLGLPNWQKYPDTPRGSATAPKIYKDGQGNTYALDLTTGKVTRLPGQPKPQAAPAKLTFKNIGGRMVGIDPYTGQPVVDLGPAGTPKAKSAGGKPIYRQGADGRTYLIDPKTNTATAVSGLPGKGAQSAKPPSPATLKQARQLIPTVGKTSYYAKGDQKPLTNAGLRGLVAQYNQVAKAKGHTQITLADVYNMTPQELSVLGLSKKTATPQDVYLQMVQLGVPARRAWQMVRAKYPKWGEGYFKPGKADAAQAAAYSPAQSRRNTQAASTGDWHGIISSGASFYGLDPAAVLAVANAEGMSGGVGDSGTSFGPFQLHVGGALPRGKNRTWAESPAGIDYALRQIAKVARGLKGRAAIEAIVRRFERPANPSGEVERAYNYYLNSTV